MRADFDMSNRISERPSSRELPLRPTGRNVHQESNSENFYRSIGKPALDFGLALIALLFFLPVFILVAISIKLSDEGPIFFRHQRLGKDGKAFPCYKFRTMVPDAKERLERLLETDLASRKEWTECQKLKKDPRITATGEFLRKTSLDELPQLVNVLRGEMALVGPRPIIAAEICHYGEKFADYASVRPGISGLWQVSGRSDIGYSERVQLDVRYVRERSFRIDIKIMFKTIWVVLLRRGAS